MKNWALVALAAFLPRRPAPGLLGDDVEVDRRRPRTLVEDFIKDARPYESALPNGVEPAAEVLQHFPETSFEQILILAGSPGRRVLAACDRRLTVLPR